ncbi:MAG: hypothetical protein CFE43_05395 [Burkholderiales bacterium PBB3]|nr:MAG: hypothetical protein CFE43_05395 [Burkholderiales bacterium PBB3]
MNNDHHSQHANPAHTGTLSRRQLMLAGMAAAAGSLTTLSACTTASPAAHWSLWSVEGHGGKAYVLGGTPPQAQAWHDSRIAQLLPNCSTLWVETNRVVRGNMRELVARHGMDAQTPLSQRISTGEAQRLAQAAQAAQMRPEELAPFRPWLAALTLDNAYHAHLGHPESGSAEKVLTAMAQKTGLAVQSEFPAQDDVMVYMGGLAAEADQQFLSYTLDQILADHSANARMYSSWARGDAELAEREVLRLKAQYPQMYASMVLGRNRNWVPRFDTMLRANKPALAVLGFYHMAGPDSVLVQLQMQGWKVRAV